MRTALLLLVLLGAALAISPAFRDFGDDPEGRLGSGVCIMGRSVYATTPRTVSYGGTGNGTLDRYDKVGGLWTRVSQTPIPDAWHLACADGVIVVGGTGGGAIFTHNTSVAISGVITDVDTKGGVVIVGTPLANASVVYDAAGTELLRLTEADSSGSSFGYAVAITDAFFYVTSPGTAPAEVGLVTAFHRNGTAAHTYAGTHTFGACVAADADLVVVCDPNWNGTIGRALFLTETGSALALRAVPGLPAFVAGDFGIQAAAIHADRVLLGGRSVQVMGEQQGYAGLYTRAGALRATFSGFNETGMQFGYAVAVSDSLVAVGAPDHNVGPEDDNGALAIYDVLFPAKAGDGTIALVLVLALGVPTAALVGAGALVALAFLA